MERKPDNRPKRTRSAEVHNQSERRRRDRINKRLKSLQELVPNCNKMMSVQEGAIFKAPFMSPSGYQSTQVLQFSPNVPISPKLEMDIGFGTGMVNMCRSAGHPMISSAPSASLHPSLAAGVGLPLMSASRNLAISQMQMPCIPSQQLRPSVDTSAMIQNFVLGGYSSAFNFSNEVESSSQTMPGTSTDHQQDYRPSGHGSSSTTLM